MRLHRVLRLAGSRSRRYCRWDSSHRRESILAWLLDHHLKVRQFVFQAFFEKDERVPCGIQGRVAPEVKIGNRYSAKSSRLCSEIPLHTPLSVQAFRRSSLHTTNEVSPRPFVAYLVSHLLAGPPRLPWGPVETRPGTTQRWKRT